jgi:DNA-binding CsgD family transcriptional regulator
MRRRLLVYLLLITFTMLAGVILLLSVRGVFPSGSGEMEKLFSNELSRLSENTLKQYGAASVQAARMSELLASAITNFMKREKLSPTEFKNRPELLESLSKDLVLILLFNLFSAEFSGAFVTLDTTVNPNIRGAENSKAGLYIRSIEPNIGGTGAEMRYLLRGFPSLIGDNYINFQAKWDLEFDVKDQLFWIEPLKAHMANPSLPLSWLLFWCSMSPVQGLNENVMVCSVPVFDNAGRIMGVCGFEISEMNFMLRREPNISDFHNMVYMFSPANDGQIRLEGSLFSGNNAVYNTLRKQGSMSVTGNTGKLSVYGTPDGASFVGMDKAIQVYPNDSPFADARFAAALVVPWEDYYDIVSTSRLRLFLIGAAFLCVGVALSLFLSYRYEKPFKELLEALRSGDMSAKSQIQEIDDLLEFMRSQLNESRSAENGNRKSAEEDEESMEKSLEDSSENMLDSFIANTKKLSRAEADVFNLYLEGCTAQEIASTLSLSINTIKTHNRRVFEKLNVSSRKELLTWVQVLTASGRSLDDSQQRQFDEIRNIVKNSGNAN